MISDKRLIKTYTVYIRHKHVNLAKPEFQTPMQKKIDMFPTLTHIIYIVESIKLSPVVVSLLSTRSTDQRVASLGVNVQI